MCPFYFKIDSIIPTVKGKKSFTVRDYLKEVDNFVYVSDL